MDNKCIDYDIIETLLIKRRGKRNLHDMCGNWVAGFATKLGICSVTSVELWGIWDGLLLAWELRF